MESDTFALTFGSGASSESLITVADYLAEDTISISSFGGTLDNGRW